MGNPKWKWLNFKESQCENIGQFGGEFVKKGVINNVSHERCLKKTKKKTHKNNNNKIIQLATKILLKQLYVGFKFNGIG